jgi:hypothetical protein
MHQLRRRSEFTSAFDGIAGVTGLAGGPPMSRIDPKLTFGWAGLCWGAAAVGQRHEADVKAVA